jgi:hypothetical protein
VRSAAVALAAIACLAPTSSCTATAPPASAHLAIDAEPRWEDVIDTTPELLAVVFPTALRRDKVYGPLLRRVIDLVREQSRVVAETRALDAMEDAEEVIIGVRPDANGPGGADGASGEVVVVVRGVRADVDPAQLVDAEGHPLWAPGPSGRVRELVRSDPPSSTGVSTVSSTTTGSSSAPTVAAIPASLFELPGRTWVIASGEARARARGVFAHPLGRPGLRFEPSGVDTLALLRIDGPSLVARVRALQALGALGTLGRHLEAVTLELAAGGVGQDAMADGSVSRPATADAGVVDVPADLRRTIRASLSYSSADAATLAEATVRDVVGAIARKRPDDLVWLASATVDRPSPAGGGGGAQGQGQDKRGKSVLVTAPLPPQLVGALLHAGAGALTTPALPP